MIKSKWWYSPLLFIAFFAHGEGMKRYLAKDLPKPLTEIDAHRYRTAFKLQQKEYWDEAQFVRSAIENKTLVPWLNFQSYNHVSNPQGTFEDLNQFIKKNPLHPEVKVIYEKAKKLSLPVGQILIKPKKVKRGTAFFQKKSIKVKQAQKVKKQVIDNGKTIFQKHQATYFMLKIKNKIEQGQIDIAEDLILSGFATSILPFYQRDSSFAKGARLLFNKGRDDLLIELSAKVFQKNQGEFSDVWWILGLSFWRQQQYQQAAQYFEEITQRPWLHENLVYGAYYWIARCQLMLLEYERWQENLTIAAQNNDHFYGVLSAETLGKINNYQALNPLKKVEEFFNTSEGQRFTALIQLDKKQWARKEIFTYMDGASMEDYMALLWLAGEFGWTEVVYQKLDKLKKYGVDVAPILPRIPLKWVPSSDMRLDEAFTLSIIEKESRFKPKARSKAGAQGLMQITKQTQIQTQNVYRLKQNYNLMDGQDNITIGQYYMQYLLSQEAFKGNLFFSLAAWNAGPARAKRWKKEAWRQADDPIFWLEAMPVKETRLYVKEVSANLWKYRNRLGQKQPTLEALAQNKEPIYHDMDLAVGFNQK